MPFQNLSHSNNAITTFAGGISTIGTILIVKSGTGVLFPSVFPYLLVLEKIVNNVVTRRELVKAIRKDGDAFTIARSAGYCMENDTATTKTNTPFEFDADDKVSLRLYEEEISDMHDEIVRLGAITVTDATDIQKGTVKLSVAPVSSINPIALSESDTRLPNQGENDAMAGTSGTPGSGNKYVSQTDPTIIDNMSLSGNQAIDGVKTFSSIPEVVGTPSGANDFINLTYFNTL